MKDKEQGKFSYGGQALIEGVMMRGRNSVAIAVREPSGNIAVECKRAADVKKSLWYRIPVVRGVFNFASSLGIGFKALMKSAEAAGGEDEQIGKGGMAIAVIAALALFIGLFIFLPRIIASALEKWLFESSGNALLYANVIESIMRILIFILYLWAVSLMKDIKRTYMYHGAEHKTINAYEKGGEITPESIKGFSTRHNRCGTTFLFFVIVISILVFTLVTWVLSRLGVNKEAFASGFVYNLVLMGVRLALLPFVAGLSYELLRLLAKGSDKNIILRVLRAPGLGLQRLTTKEPDDAMLEVAAAAFSAARAMDNDPEMKDYGFELTTDFKSFYEGKKKELEAAKADAAALDWACCDILGATRGELPALKIIKRKDGEKISAVCDKLKAGQPLQYIQGWAEFMGYRFAVDKSVLIPRPETEILVSEAVKYIELTRRQMGTSQQTEAGEPVSRGMPSGTGSGVPVCPSVSCEQIRVLDLCCGSGCIGLSAALKTGCAVTLSDVSAEALGKARENAEKLIGQEHKGAGDVVLLNTAAQPPCVPFPAFVQSDMFAKISGQYDVIACNPPYVKTADIQTLDKTVKDYEPVSALDGGADGLDFYRAFKENFPPFLRRGGAAFLEIGAGQAPEIKNIFKGFYIETVKDYNGTDRVLIIRNNDV